MRLQFLKERKKQGSHLAIVASEDLKEKAV